MARRCGAKRICNSKSWTTDGLGPFLEVRMWKNGTVLRRKPHLQVKMHNIPNIPRPLLGVMMFKKWHRRCGMKALGRFFGSCRCRSCGKRQTGAKVHLQVSICTKHLRCPADEIDIV